MDEFPEMGGLGTDGLDWWVGRGGVREGEKKKAKKQKKQKSKKQEKKQEKEIPV